MRIPILALGLAVALLGVPFEGVLAADSCGPCCSQPAVPCSDGAEPCLEMAAGACCDAALALPAAPAKRTVDPPSCSISPVSQPEGAPPGRAQRGRAGDGLRQLPSPLRLSVVLNL